MSSDSGSSMVSSSSITSSYSTPSASCVAEDKSGYTSQEDGSEFIVLCNQGFQELHLAGSPIQLMNNNLEACTEQCAAAGTACAGVTFGFFGGEQQQCYLYTRMLASEAPAYPIVAAVRTSNFEGALGRRRILRNGGFDGALSPWTSGQTASGSEFTIKNNAANVVMLLTTRAANNGAAVVDSVTLEQQISDPADANVGYYTSLDITVTSDRPVECQINVRSVSSGESFFGLFVRNTVGPRTVYGSGTTQLPDVSTILMNVDCNGTRDVEVQLDNLGFWSFEPDNSGSGCDTSLLTNGNFDSSLSPWIPAQGGTSTSATWSVSDGQVIVRWAANTGINDAPATLTQSIDMPGSDTPYRITADLVFTIASGSCSVGFGTEIETLYFNGQTAQSGRVPITYDGISEIQARQFVISITCYSPTGGINSVGIDSIELVMNPGADCPASG